MTAAVVLAGAAVRVGGRTIVGPLDLSIDTGEKRQLTTPSGLAGVGSEPGTEGPADHGERRDRRPSLPH